MDYKRNNLDLQPLFIVSVWRGWLTLGKFLGMTITPQLTAVHKDKDNKDIFCMNSSQLRTADKSTAFTLGKLLSSQNKMLIQSHFKMNNTCFQFLVRHWHWTKCQSVKWNFHIYTPVKIKKNKNSMASVCLIVSSRKGSNKNDVQRLCFLTFERVFPHFHWYF